MLYSCTIVGVKGLMPCSHYMERALVYSAAGDQSTDGSERNATGSHVGETQPPIQRDPVQLLRLGYDFSRSRRRSLHQRVYAAHRL